MNRRLKLLMQIFAVFFKIGPLTFGGGYAMIPLIEKEVVEKREWVKTSKEIADIFAIAGSLPGAIVINAATIVGFRLAGVAGAVAAMAGVMFPTFVIVLLLGIFFVQLQDHPKLEAAFTAIRATIVALIAHAALNVGKTAVFDKTTFGILLGTVALLLFRHIHPLLLIVAGIAAGIASISLKKKLGMNIQFEKEESGYKYKDYFIGDGI